MATGWIKLHRKLLDNPVACKDSDHLAVWIYLLLNATHKKIPMMFGKKRIDLQPGQLITSAESISAKTGVEPSKVKRILKLFKSDRQIDQQSERYGRLISILNWHEYQDDDRQDDRRVTDERPTSDRRVTANKNVKNIKNDKKSTTTALQTLSPKEVISMWNAVGVNPIKSINAGTKRHGALNARIREHGAEAVIQAIQNVKESDFLKGKNRNAWTITFDWFIKPNNFLKVYEGNYANREQQSTITTKMTSQGMTDDDLLARYGAFRGGNR